MDRRKLDRKSEKGVALLEALIAAVIVGIGFAAVYGLSVTSTRVLLSSIDREKQNMLATMIYEDLLTDINRQLVRIFGFLGMRPKIKRSELIAKTKFSYLQAQERSDGFRESVNDQPFFRRGISGEGKIFIGTNFKEMEKEFSDVMSSFDYT